MCECKAHRQASDSAPDSTPLLIQVLKKIAKFIQEQNDKIYAPRGLLLTDPIERGLRVVSFGPAPSPLAASSCVLMTSRSEPGPRCVTRTWRWEHLHWEKPATKTAERFGPETSSSGRSQVMRGRGSRTQPGGTPEVVFLWKKTTAVSADVMYEVT